MRKKELFAQVLDFFERTMDATETELDFRNNFELVVAVVLSAQCTDKRINQVTPRLFQDFPTPEAMAQTTSEVIFDYIKSVSYPNNKAKHLVGLAQKLVADFNGEVPSTLEELTSLPGVGRKTANVVQAVAFHKAALAVDTHVFRVSHRLKLVPKLYNSLQCGDGIDEAHSRFQSGCCSLLVASPRSLYLPCKKTALSQMWIGALVSIDW